MSKTTIPVQIQWKDIKYTVQLEDPDASQPCCGEKILREKVILNDLSGFVVPGTMLAIMGPSGSGKTTMLNVLAGRINRKRWQGEVLVNNQPATRDILKVAAGYVPQDDILFGSQTVYEALMFYAQLKLSNLTQIEKEERVNHLIENLGLTKVRNSIIGFVGSEAANSGLQRGVSGGERKRTSIAQQLVTNPSLLFLDEPTTGLDSFAAEAVIRVLAKQLQLGRTIIFTIHQPSTDVLKLFDQLLILAHGRVIYFGPQTKALRYFSSVGYPCPPDENPGDYFVEILHKEPEIRSSTESENDKISDDEKDKKKENSPVYEKGVYEDGAFADLHSRTLLLADKFKNSKYTKEVPPDVPTNATLPPLVRAPITTQISELLKRNFVYLLREPASAKASLAQSFLVSIVFGVIYLQLGHDQASIQDKSGALFFGTVFLMFGGILAPLTLFAAERRLFLFQYHEALYTPTAYYWCKVLPEIIPVIINTIIFSVIFYFMLGLRAGADHFFLFFIISTVMVIAAQAFAFFLSGLFSDAGIVLTVFPIFFLPQMIFSGFYLNSASTPVYFIWVEYLSIIKYAFRSLARNEFQGEVFYCTQAELNLNKGICPYTIGDEWLQFRDLDNFPIFGDILVLLLMIIVYHTIGFLLLRRMALLSIK